MIQMFYDKHAKILITVVCAILGVMLATQFNTNETRKANIPYQRAEDLGEG